MLNQVILIGKVDKIEKTDNGHLYLNLAVEREYKDIGGKFKTDNIRCLLWKGISDSIKNYYKSGQYLSICGRIEELEDGSNVVIAEKVSFIGRTSKGEEFVKE